MAMDVISDLPPRLTLLHEDTDSDLRRTIGAIPSSWLDPASTLESTALAPYPSDSEVVSSMLSSASSIQSVSVTPTPHVEPPPDVDAVVKHGQNGLVASGTLPGLILKLIDAKVDRNYKETFLALYRSFTTGEEVLQRLINQFEAASSQTTEPSTDVRPYIFLVMELWQDLDYIGPADVQLLQRMRNFAASVQASSALSRFSHRAQKLVDSIENTLGLFASATPPLTPSLSTSSLTDTRLPVDLSARDLADVLASIEGDRYRKLRELDYVHWLEGNQESNVVSLFIDENRKLGYWAERSILRPEHHSHRAENLRYFLLAIKECIRLRNFSSACALSAGVTTKAIVDLWRTCDGRSQPFRDAKKLISVEKNFESYRSAIKESNNGCIPWLYVHLHDIKIIHRASSKLVDEDDHTKLINFDHCRRVHRLIRLIRGYEPPVFKPTNPAHHGRFRILVESELNAMIINQQYCDWVQKRGVKLAAEEQRNYVSHEEELRKAGFVPRRASSTVPPIRRPSNNFRRASSAFMPPTPRSGTLLTPIQPPGANKSEDVDIRPRPLDVFDRSSEKCLDGRITRSSSYPTDGGGNADIWEGTMLDGRKVAIKCIRPFSSNGGRLEKNRLLKRLWREYTSWAPVSHPNILTCLGFTYDFSLEHCSLPSLISPWMSNGTLTSYLKSHPEVDRLKILLDVAEGLSFLHVQNPPIIHGDIRGNNILISESGVPCLSDFGLSKVLMLEGMTATSEPGGSMRWMAPELFRGDYLPSPKSDVWAYAMTILEIMSGRAPYPGVPDGGVVGQVCSGQLPLGLNTMPPGVRRICQKCWSTMSEQRPSMHEVFSELASLIHSGT